MMPDHQYWFIKYRWQRSGDKRSDWNHCNKIIGQNPLHWLADMKKYLDPKETKGRAEIFVLDFYFPITAYMFKRYKDEFD